MELTEASISEIAGQPQPRDLQGVDAFEASISEIAGQPQLGRIFEILGGKASISEIAGQSQPFCPSGRMVSSVGVEL